MAVATECRDDLGSSDGLACVGRFQVQIIFNGSYREQCCFQGPRDARLLEVSEPIESVIVLEWAVAPGSHGQSVGGTEVPIQSAWQDSSMADRAGREPLHYAALENDTTETAKLLAGGADPDVRDRDGFTPLHLAAQAGAVEAATLLLDAGGDANAVNLHGNSPLFVAVFNSKGEGDLIRLLRERGADPRLMNTHGQTPVGLARLIGNYPVAQFFGDLPE
jgi:hypothetical protein